MRRLTSLVSFLCIVMVADVAGAAAIFQWRDAGGALHFSNRLEAIPTGATELTLPPVRTRVPSPAVAERPIAAGVSAPAPPIRRRASECAVPDATGLADAVTTRLGGELDRLTLIVAGTPVAYDSDTRVDVKGPDVDLRRAASTGQAAIAYSERTGCPSRPPLERYAVRSRRAPARRLCDDYQRAFAEVGVAVNRDQRIEHAFHGLAQEFVDVAAGGYTAGGRQAAITAPGPGAPIVYAREERVPLPPWLVDAHVAQTRELSTESSALVDELTVALEEIDAAARRAGCW